MLTGRVMGGRRERSAESEAAKAERREQKAVAKGERREQKAVARVARRDQRATAKGKRRDLQRLPGRRFRRGRLAHESVVNVEYAPCIDGDPDPGEIVWAWVPFEEDPTQGKDRPVVVIGRSGGRMVGVPLTSKPDDREAQVCVGTGPWDPKRRTSYARIWRMIDFEASGMRREGAVLERKRFDQIVNAVDRYYKIRRTAVGVAA